jgi:hypothetical protein
MKIFHVDEMLEDLSTTELLGWLDFYELEPFGNQIENYRASIVASAIYNVNRTDKNDKVWGYKDFFNNNSVESEQSEEEMIQIATLYTNAFNGKGGN